MLYHHYSISVPTIIFAHVSLGSFVNVLNSINVATILQTALPNAISSKSFLLLNQIGLILSIDIELIVKDLFR